MSEEHDLIEHMDSCFPFGCLCIKICWKNQTKNNNFFSHFCLYFFLFHWRQNKFIYGYLSNFFSQKTESFIISYLFEDNAIFSLYYLLTFFFSTLTSRHVSEKDRHTTLYTVCTVYFRYENISWSLIFLSSLFYFDILINFIFNKKKVKQKL